MLSLLGPGGLTKSAGPRVSRSWCSAQIWISSPRWASPQRHLGRRVGNVASEMGGFGFRKWMIWGYPFFRKAPNHALTISGPSAGVNRPQVKQFQIQSQKVFGAVGIGKSMVDIGHPLWVMVENWNNQRSKWVDLFSKPRLMTGGKVVNCWVVASIINGLFRWLVHPQKLASSGTNHGPTKCGLQVFSSGRRGNKVGQCKRMMTDSVIYQLPGGPVPAKLRSSKWLPPKLDSYVEKYD